MKTDRKNLLQFLPDRIGELIHAGRYPMEYACSSRRSVSYARRAMTCTTVSHGAKDRFSSILDGTGRPAVSIRFQDDNDKRRSIGRRLSFQYDTYSKFRERLETAADVLWEAVPHRSRRLP